MSEPIPATYREITRADWARLAAGIPQPLTADEIEHLRGLGDRLDLREVADVYLPLSRLLSGYAAGAKSLGAATAAFLREADTTTPFIITIAGSVAVGKSTIARLLRELIARWSDTPRVQLVTTDGFLLPNAELERRGLMRRKGFPESYDRRALVDFVRAVKSGETEVRAPVYSHRSYDIVPGEQVRVRRPDVLLVEGLNVLQPPPTPNDVSVGEFFDFSIYVDAAASEIERWYTERFLALREAAFRDPASYFRSYADLGDADAIAAAAGFWHGVNLPNLRENVLPTRHRADLVLRKGPHHAVESVLLRKL